MPLFSAITCYETKYRLVFLFVQLLVGGDGCLDFSTKQSPTDVTRRMIFPFTFYRWDSQPEGMSKMSFSSGLEYHSRHAFFDPPKAVLLCEIHYYSEYNSLTLCAE